MCGGDIAPLLRGAVRERQRAGDHRIGYVQLPACPEKGLGSRAHPGRDNHRSAALAVVRRLKTALEKKSEDRYGYERGRSAEGEGFRGERVL